MNQEYLHIKASYICCLGLIYFSTPKIYCFLYRKARDQKAENMLKQNNPGLYMKREKLFYN